MKVAVSIPDPVFAKADELAKRMKMTRSGVYARALSDFVEKHDPDRLTEMANAFADEIAADFETEIRPLLRSSARTVLKHTEW